MKLIGLSKRPNACPYSGCPESIRVDTKGVVGTTTYIEGRCRKHGRLFFQAEDDVMYETDEEMDYRLAQEEAEASALEFEEDWG